MKFIIAVDLEGVACVVGAPNGTLNDSPNFEFARRQATREADAAAKALFDAGAQEVLIWDNHHSGLNLLYDELDERCGIILGTGAEHRWPGLNESFSGVLLIGYHPMDNTADGVLAHTFSSAAYQWMKINNEQVGEMEIDAAMAGKKGVPVILVSSDDKGTAEAKRFMPWIETVTTKKGLGWNIAISKHPKQVVREIYEGTKKAVLRLKEMKIFSFKEPILFQLRFKRLENAQNTARDQKGWSSVDPYTLEKKLESLNDYF